MYNVSLREDILIKTRLKQRKENSFPVGICFLMSYDLSNVGEENLTGPGVEQSQLQTKARCIWNWAAHHQLWGHSSAEPVHTQDRRLSLNHAHTHTHSHTQTHTHKHKP